MEIRVCEHLVNPIGKHVHAINIPVGFTQYPSRQMVPDKSVYPKDQHVLFALLFLFDFNLTVELPLKAIVRGYSWTVIPITWRNRRTGVAKLKIREKTLIFAAESLLHQQVVTKFQEKIQNLTHEQTHLFGYVNKKLDSQVTFAFSHFSQTDVGIRPDFSKHKVAIFMQRHYRVCINLDVDNYKIIHYVMANTHAVHKLAISPDYPKL